MSAASMSRQTIAACLRLYLKNDEKKKFMQKRFNSYIRFFYLEMLSRKYKTKVKNPSH